MKKRKHDKRVLLLNADYSSLAIISWQRAMILSFVNQENAAKGLEVVNYYEDFVESCGHRHFPIPSIVRSPIYIRQERRKVSFSRTHLFIRDDFTCQYCGKFCPGGGLTYDHLISRSEWNRKHMKGTPTTFTNVVAACVQCNRKKADKALKNSGLILKREPFEPHPRTVVLGLHPFRKRIPGDWLTYLPVKYKELIEKKHQISVTV